MKLTPESIKQLKTLLQTVSIVKIDRIIIEDNTVRGVDDDQTVVIISKDGVPNFGGARVGLNRLSMLVNRINLFDQNQDFVVEAVEAPKRESDEAINIASFKLASKGAKFEFRCAKPDMIKAPKRINDTMVWSITIPADAVKLVISAANTMGSEQIALVSKSSGEVSFEIVDSVTQDSFSSTVASSAEWISDEDPQTQSFVHFYSSKALVSLLKASLPASDPVIYVGEEGMLQIKVNGHTFTLLPREDE